MSQPNRPPQLEYPYETRPPLQSESAPIKFPAVTWSGNPNWLGLACVAIGCTVANLALVPLMDVFRPNNLGVVWPITCLGIMLAEGFLLAAWLVWSEGSFLRRLVIHWTAVIWFALAWLIGAVFTDGFGSDVRDGLENIPFVLPLLSVSIQLPLWIARQ